MSWLFVSAAAVQTLALHFAWRRRPLHRSGAAFGAAIGLGVLLTAAEGALLLGEVLAAGEPSRSASNAGLVALLAAFACLVVAVTPMQAQRPASDPQPASPTTVRGVAHDLRNLLTVIYGHAATIELGVDDSAKVQASLSKLRDASQRAGELLAQFERTCVVADPDQRVCDAVEIVRESRNLLVSAVPRGVTLAIDLESGPIEAACDAVDFTRILLNLVVNAGEAIGSRGGVINVWVGVRNVDDAWRAAAHPSQKAPHGPAVWLRVSDDGPGLPEHLGSRVFERDVSTKGPDRGLGLSIVSEIVRRAGGAVRVSSAPQRGATFEVALPLGARRRRSARVA